MSRRSDKPEPTDAAIARKNEIWQKVMETLHYVENDEQAQAKGIPAELHAWHHQIWAWAFFIGMEYALNHPKKAGRLFRIKLAANDQESKIVDLLSEHLMGLFPADVPKVDANKLLDVKDRYKITPVDVVPVMPAFDEIGRLVWEALDEGKYPFPWENELETWEDSSE